MLRPKGEIETDVSHHCALPQLRHLHAQATIAKDPSMPSTHVLPNILSTSLPSPASLLAGGEGEREREVYTSQSSNRVNTTQRRVSDISAEEALTSATRGGVAGAEASISSLPIISFPRISSPRLTTRYACGEEDVSQYQKGRDEDRFETEAEAVKAEHPVSRGGVGWGGG